MPFHIISLQPKDVIWWHRFESTSAQAMACCLMAPSHYLKQCWLNINKVHQHTFERNFTRDTSTINHLYHHENCTWKIVLNKMNPGYFPLAATALKPQQISMLLHISARVWGRLGASVISTHTRTEGFYVKTAVIHQLKCLCIPDCAYMESMFINFTHKMSVWYLSHTEHFILNKKRCGCMKEIRMPPA